MDRAVLVDVPELVKYSERFMIGIAPILPCMIGLHRVHASNACRKEPAKFLPTGRFKMLSLHAYWEGGVDVALLPGIMNYELPHKMVKARTKIVDDFPYLRGPFYRRRFESHLYNAISALRIKINALSVASALPKETLYITSEAFYAITCPL